jgi:hypothetical protein
MTQLAPVNIANAQGGTGKDESVLRSGGQTHEFPPGPRIVTARPRPSAERRAADPRPVRPERPDAP